MDTELGNVDSPLNGIASVDRLSRIHGLMAVSRLTYKEAERLVLLSEQIGRPAIHIWAEELSQKARKPHETVV